MIAKLLKSRRVAIIVLVYLLSLVVVGLIFWLVYCVSQAVELNQFDCASNFSMIALVCMLMYIVLIVVGFETVRRTRLSIKSNFVVVSNALFGLNACIIFSGIFFTQQLATIDNWMQFVRNDPLWTNTMVLYSNIWLALVNIAILFVYMIVIDYSTVDSR